MKEGSVSTLALFQDTSQNLEKLKLASKISQVLFLKKTGDEKQEQNRRFEFGSVLNPAYGSDLAPTKCTEKIAYIFHFVHDRY